MAKILCIDATGGMTLAGLLGALSTLAASGQNDEPEGWRSLFEGAAELLEKSGIGNADLAGLEKAAKALAGIGAGGISCSPFPLPGAAVIQGAVYAQKSGEAEPEAVALLTFAAGKELRAPFRLLKSAAFAGGPVVFLGEPQGGETLTVLEANLDDMTGELLGLLPGLCLEAGALDAWLIPALMKKGRPAHILCALCEEKKRDTVEEAIFIHSTTIGVRSYAVKRRAAQRSLTEVPTPWGPVRIKVATLGERVVNAAPEFGDCERIAAAAGVPVKKVYAEAVASWENLKNNVRPGRKGDFHG